MKRVVVHFLGEDGYVACLRVTMGTAARQEGVSPKLTIRKGETTCLKCLETFKEMEQDAREALLRP